MLKRYGTVILATMVTASMFISAGTVLAEQSKQEMEEEITTLKKDLGDVQDMLDELDQRVGDNEKHTASDRVNWNVDLRTEVSSLHYMDALVLPEFAQTMLTGWAWDQLAVPVGDPDQDGIADFSFNPTFAGQYQAVLGEMMPAMFMGGFLSGFYLPTGAPSFGLPVGFVSAETAGMMMVGNGMNPNDPAQVATFFGMFTAAAPDAYPIISNQATVYGAAGNIVSQYDTGTPLFSRNFNRDEMIMYQNMFKGIAPAKADIDNDAIPTTRIRMDFRSDPHPHLTFGARLTANKIWGDSTGVKWFNGSFDSIAMDGNVHNKGTDSVMRLERGFVTYRSDLGDLHWHFSLGRRPAQDGGPWEVSTHGNLGASPLAHVINWQFDGASLGLDISKYTGLEGMNFKICYGQGFESGAGAGNSNAMSHSNDINDVNFMGYIFRIFENSNFKVSHLFARAFDVTDGFTGLTAMPFAINGQDLNNDGTYENYTLDVNYGGYISRFEPTTNLGSIDLVSLLVQGKTKGIDWFIDLASNMAHPSAFSRSAMFQFMEMDSMLNESGSLDDHEGYSVWVGVKLPIPWTDGALGFEYNWGSQYWFGFNISEDTLGANKLAARGDVYEVYYHQPIIGTKFMVSVGGQYYDYEYTGSGNFLGMPKKIDEATALDAVMPVVSEMWTVYANLNYRW